MKRLLRKKKTMQAVSAVCNMGGTLMMVMTVCQIARAAEYETVLGICGGLLLAMVHGLTALLLWSYGLDMAAGARAITRKVAKMQMREMYRKIQQAKPGTYYYYDKNCG